MSKVRWRKLPETVVGSIPCVIVLSITEANGLRSIPAVTAPAMILVVEDDDSVRRFSLFVLREHGFRTLEAFDGESGLEAFLRHKDEVDLILTDVVMPQRSGPEMVEALLNVEPSARVVFMSGTAETSDFPQPLKKVPVLYKPFTAERLVNFVRQSLDVKNGYVAE